jgi:hypothetical protein
VRHVFVQNHRPLGSQKAPTGIDSLNGTFERTIPTRAHTRRLVSAVRSARGFAGRALQPPSSIQTATPNSLASVDSHGKRSGVVGKIRVVDA